MAKYMPTDPSPPQPLRRLKWIILGLTILLITLIESYHFISANNILGHAIAWLLGVIGAVVLVSFTFREVGRLQKRLDRQLADSHLQLQRQAVLVQLSLKLAPTLDEERIANLVTSELRYSMGYAHVELMLADKISSRDRMPPASPFYNPARQEFPLQAGGESLGNLVVEKQDLEGFNTQDHTFLSAIASQAALAIVNSRLLEDQRKQRLSAELREAELRSQQRSLNLLNQITQAALRSPDLTSIQQTLTQELASLFRADDALLAAWDSQRQQPQLVAHCTAEPVPGRDPAIPSGDLGLVETVLSSGQPLALPWVEKSALAGTYLVSQLKVQSLLALPLITTDQKLGAALLTFRNQRDFSPAEVSLAEQAASQVALAIAKAGALKTAQERAQELDALQRATTALLGTLDLEDLLSQILDAALSAIPAAQQGLVHLVAHDTGQLQLRAMQSQADPRIRLLDQASTSGDTARAVRERKALLIPGTPDGDSPTSAIIAPLVMGEQALGAIALEAPHSEAFTDADVALLTSFAATATSAIHAAQLHAEVQKQAITDTLTGFYNRRGFSELGRREVERSLRFGHPLSAMMLDIDMFKQINDIYGHLTGDRVLVGITHHCAQELRQIDLLGRYGGDEFVVLLPETGVENARRVAERLRATIAALPFNANGKPLNITISVGVACMQDGCKSLEELLERADGALYQAKESGRNRVMAV
jgi:diguanylate cyclase (GGDEF)-like protein